MSLVISEIIVPGNIHTQSYSVLIRIAPDFIFFKSGRGRIWRDLGLQIRPGPGLEPNVLELEA